MGCARGAGARSVDGSIRGGTACTPGAGEVRVTIDNDGTVTNVQSSVRPVARLHDRPRNTTNAPLQEGPIARADVSDDGGYERLLAAEWRKRLAAWVVRGEAPAQYTIVPGSTEIGYDIRGNQAIIVARRAIEVDLGRGSPGRKAEGLAHRRVQLTRVAHRDVADDQLRATARVPGYP